MSTLKPLALILLISLGTTAFAASHSATQAQDGDNNEVILEQSGQGNTATQTQTGSAHRSAITQNGSINSAETTQLGLENAVALYQTGDSNIAQVYQESFIYGHSATVTQLGDTNHVTLYQQNGNGSVATLYQEGNNNIHEVEQNGEGFKELVARTVGTGNRLDAIQRNEGCICTDYPDRRQQPHQSGSDWQYGRKLDHDYPRRQQQPGVGNADLGPLPCWASDADAGRRCQYVDHQSAWRL